MIKNLVQILKNRIRKMETQENLAIIDIIDGVSYFPLQPTTNPSRTDMTHSELLTAVNPSVPDGREGSRGYSCVHVPSPSPGMGHAARESVRNRMV